MFRNSSLQNLIKTEILSTYQKFIVQNINQKLKYLFHVVMLDFIQ